MTLPAIFETKPASKVRERRKLYETQLAELKNERSSFESHWRELTDYILPRRGRFLITDVNRGDRRTRFINNSTATLASRTLSAGMMGGVTSPARPWFRLSVPDPELNEIVGVKRWLAEVTRRMSTMFLQSNIYNTLPTLYKDLGTFSTAAMFIEEDFDQVMRTYSLPIGSYWVSNNERGKIDVFMREFRMTVRQIVEKFAKKNANGDILWDNISLSIRSAWETDKREQWFDIVHVVVPNEDHDESKLEARFKKYVSLYWEKGTTNDGTNDGEKYLRESGYEHFPVLVTRWETTGEDVYGTDCPGMTALPDIKQLQHMEKKTMQAIDKMVNPPMKAPSSLKTAKTSLLPGDVTYVDEIDGKNSYKPVHEVQPRIAEQDGKAQQTAQRIKRSYFEDLFLLLALSDRREMTAREVEEKHQEKLLILGPVLEQLNQDLLDPLIDLAFNFMLRQGDIPEPPEELMGSRLKVEYISIMAQAQKLAGLASVERFAGFIGQVAQYVPEVLDKVDADKMVDVYAETVGLQPDIVLSDDEVALIREARAEAFAEQQAAEQAAQAAATAKDLSQSDTSGDNALTTLADLAGEAAPATEGEAIPA